MSVVVPTYKKAWLSFCVGDDIYIPDNDGDRYLVEFCDSTRADMYWYIYNCPLAMSVVLTNTMTIFLLNCPATI